MSEIIKYYAAGVAVNIGGYLAYLALIEFGMGHKLSASVVYVAGTAISFIFNRHCVFNSGNATALALRRFVSILLIGYSINLLILFAGVDLYDGDPAWIQLAATVIVSLFLFAGNKLYVHSASTAGFSKIPMIDVPQGKRI